MDQLANAAHAPPLNYPARRSRRPTTIEQTSKFWKGQIASASVMLSVTVMVLLAGIVMQSNNIWNGAMFLIGIGGVGTAIALAWYCYARFGAWWHHG